MENKRNFKKQLVINADDFGLDPAINAGIIESFKKGVVTNTSMMPCGKAFEESVEFARRHNGLGVGIHLALNEETPVLPRDKISSLVSKRKDSFLAFPIFIKRFLSGRIAINHVYSEFEAQIERFVKTGLKPTHLDTHKHIHLIPRLLEVLLTLSRKFGIARI
ncbi:MAG: ChbG/HpnK family deacetylase, partial [Candidatus Omnitrophica bacterium]|nr:ChbG/HpnK family deacetylase [Candidatus Omnitrophota bacterium]